MYKTITLGGTEQEVKLAGQNCDIRNDGAETVYISAKPNITAGADGVLSVPVGQAAKLLDCRGTAYLLGTGTVLLCGNDYAELVFKCAATSSGEGGTEDTVARTAINAHASTENIHLTAEKAIEAAATTVSNPNLLINPDFKINQRGQIEYAGAGYAVDGWYVQNSPTALLSIEDGYVRFTCNISLVQYTENCKSGVYTISMRYRKKANSIFKLVIVTGIENVSINELQTAEDWLTKSVTFEYFGTEPLEVHIYGGGNSSIDNYIDLEWLKLELGSVATPFTPPDTATELAKCQRYYQIRTTGDIDPVDLRPSMRITPTVTQLDDSNYAYNAEI